MKLKVLTIDERIICGKARESWRFSDFPYFVDGLILVARCLSESVSWLVTRDDTGMDAARE